MGVTVKEKVPGSGVYWVFVNHKNQRTSKRVGSEKAALKVAEQLEAHLALGSLDIDKKDIPTLKKYSEEWLDKVVKLSRKYGTYRAYKIILDTHVNPVLGSKGLDEITAKDVSDLVLAKIGAGLRSNTVKCIKDCLGAVLKRAVHPDGYIKANPARGVEVPKPIDEVSRRVPDPLTWEERDILEATFREHYPAHYPMIVCGFRTGLRIGELTALQWGDIDFVKRHILVQRNVSNGRVTTPKSKSSKRLVRMTSALVEVLERHRRVMIEKTLRKGWGDPPKWVFAAEEGGFIHYPRFMEKVWDKALTKSGLRRRTPHDMRHTYATLRLSKGDSLAEVSKELGHASADITYKVYFTWMPTESATDIDELDRRTPAHPRRTQGAQIAEIIGSG